jgi:mono/diheme cytochrome c family protein
MPLMWARSGSAAVVVVLLAVASGRAVEPSPQADPALEGEVIYQTVCATCHGADGTGEPGKLLYSIEMPDFTDCSFVTREPDADFYAVVHEGGPVRAFSPIMPPLGRSLDEEEIRAALAYLRGFCSDQRWPRGELNLPRPIYTEKAYPEDEAVITVDTNVNREDDVRMELVYEKRIGPRSQLELAVPFRAREQPDGSTRGGGGDVSIGAKHVLTHSLERGNIVSLGGEVVFPNGDDDAGLGKGTTVFEPYLAVGQIIAQDGFLQAQILGEIPADRDHADRELQARVAAGWSFAQDGGFGRVWTPMLEFIGTEVFPKKGPSFFDADLVPQLQVTLSRRQHVTLNAGVRIPLTHAAKRPTRVVVYLLWDWFDGELLDGW